MAKKIDASYAINHEKKTVILYVAKSSLSAPEQALIDAFIDEGYTTKRVEAKAKEKKPAMKSSDIENYIKALEASEQESDKAKAKEMREALEPYIVVRGGKTSYSVFECKSILLDNFLDDYNNIKKAIDPNAKLTTEDDVKKRREKKTAKTKPVEESK